jgi:uncharacterized Zn finger protein (UPF0148 family)
MLCNQCGTGLNEKGTSVLCPVCTKEKIVRGGVDTIFNVYEQYEQENAKLREVVKAQTEQLQNNIVSFAYIGFHIDSDAVVKTNEAIRAGKEALK